ncbi:MAG: glucose-1-phosphate cytidylyltransferase [Pseudomonadota bacterium]
MSHVQKLVILAGGLGTRLAEETSLKPKPMVEIGGRPILWHIMKMYERHGVTDFIVCCGYKGEVIKDFFANYFLRTADVTFDLGTNQMEVHNRRSEAWRVTLVDTGAETMTGGRLRRVRDYVKDEDAFAFTYGDGLSDIDLTAQFAFHAQHGKKATIASTVPPGRFGSLATTDGVVTEFMEKPLGDGGRINGGFFVLSPGCIDEIEDDDTVWEQAPLINLAQKGELMAFEHNGFWQPMDTLREKQYLEKLWTTRRAPWRTWDARF